ncbi:multiple epidermal growth factor-like domains protein 11, partial [Biomphalaria pfeifferi]
DVAVIAEIQPPTAKTLRSSSTEDCDQRLDPAYVLLTWSEAIPFTWLRIKVQNKTSFKDISLSLNNALCQNTRIFSVDNATLDLYCDNNVSMTTLKLEGNSLENICTLFVSGGRNFALFQKTSQSSTFNSNVYESKYAVDGKILPTCYRGFCSHTNTDDTTPYWIVKFGQEYNIKKCILYNR